MGAKVGSGGGGRRGRRGNGGGSFNDINVTPMVDVMLVLLIIFMVAAPMLTAGVTVDLPETSATPVPGNDEPLVVSVDSKGLIYIGSNEKQTVKIEELGAKLAAIAGEKRDMRIFVKGDKVVDYGTVMRAIGEVNMAGFTKVALVSETIGQTPTKR